MPPNDLRLYLHISARRLIFDLNPCVRAEIPRQANCIETEKSTRSLQHLLRPVIVIIRRLCRSLRNVDRDDPRLAYRFALIATRFPHSRFAFVRTERGEGREACFKFIKRFTSIEHALSDRARALIS